MSTPEPYFAPIAAAYVRGEAKKRPGAPDVPDGLLNAPLESLSPDDIQALLMAGKSARLKLYRFKSSHAELPRVRRVISFLRSISADSLLDVGGGRGVFLWPCLTAFPRLRVTCVEKNALWAEFIDTVSNGGISRLQAVNADICAYDGQPADVVTMLEVLEHIPDVEAAVRAAARLAARYIVVSVPSKEDDNPEHIHLLTKDKLTRIFRDAGCARLKFDGVNGHLLLFAAMEAKR